MGVLLAITWELIHPAVLDDLDGYARESLSFRLWSLAIRTCLGFELQVHLGPRLECLLWPIYGTFAPLHLADGSTIRATEICTKGPNAGP